MKLFIQLFCLFPFFVAMKLFAQPAPGAGPAPFLDPGRWLDQIRADDKNSDRRISRAEYSGPKFLFDTLDENSNGFIEFPDEVITLLPSRPDGGPNMSPGGGAEKELGLRLNKKGAFQGYTFFAPIGSTSTYLIDMNGKIVHEWPSEFRPGLSVYLMDDGSILRTCKEPNRGDVHWGEGVGRIQRISWDGKVMWNFVLPRDQYMPHHDIEPLPNGNILVVARERRTAEEAIAWGRNPRSITAGELWPDTILEIEPTWPWAGKVVWQWRAWDHVVQDFDKSRKNYGDVTKHPELIDLNYTQDFTMADWLHVNGVDYNPKLDQIVISVHHFSEVWIIDHSTTTAEAAGHKGGRSGKGGDLLYRWGNPAAYRMGTFRDQQLLTQHDARWIEPGQPGVGNIMIFNNRHRDANGSYSSYSSVDEIRTPINPKGGYEKGAGAFGPAKPTWSYTAPNKSDFFSANISGAHRVSNGNTMICSGTPGVLFEVTPKGEKVWEYVNGIGRMGGGRRQGGRQVRGQPNSKLGGGPRRGLGVSGGGRPIFRATRIAPGHPALKGRKFTE